MMCEPVGRPYGDAFKLHCPCWRRLTGIEIRPTEGDTRPQARGHVRTRFETHEQWALKRRDAREVAVKGGDGNRRGSRAEGG